MEHEIKRAAPDAPNRCQAAGKGGEGQCEFVATEGSQYCFRHSGGQAAKINERQSYHGYLLNRWTQRAKGFDGDVKSLRGEIGILKMLLDTVLQRCKDEDDLFANQNTIGDLATRIQGLVRDATKLEATLGLVMDQEQAIRFVDSILAIVEAHVSPDKLKIISDEIDTLIQNYAKSKDQ